MSQYCRCPSTFSHPTSNLQLLALQPPTSAPPPNIRPASLHPPRPSKLQAFNQPAFCRVRPFNQPAFSRGFVQAGLFAIPAVCCRFVWSARWCRAWQSDAQCGGTGMLRALLAPASALLYSTGIACPCCRWRSHAHNSIYSATGVGAGGSRCRRCCCCTTLR